MITDIPQSQDFFRTSLGLLELAWGSLATLERGMRETIEYLHTRMVEEEHLHESQRSSIDLKEAAKNYWRGQALQIEAVYAIVQQSFELNLKGKIAAVNPLLILELHAGPLDHDAGGKVTGNDRSFDSFRSVAAADLVRRHDLVCDKPLSDDAKQLWETLRRTRNRLLHVASGAPRITFAEAVVALLHSYEVLFKKTSWTVDWLMRTENSQTVENYGEWDMGLPRRNLLFEVDGIISHLDPADKKRFFGITTGRTYLCLACYGEIEHHYCDGLPHLAQLPPRSRGAKILRCAICGEESTVTREACIWHGCAGDVLDEPEGKCLTCEQSQEKLSDITERPRYARSMSGKGRYGGRRPPIADAPEAGGSDERVKGVASETVPEENSATHHHGS